MPHLREIPQHKCRCGQPARVELFNDRNAPNGRYCRSCGARALREELRRLKKIAKGNPW